jgi:glycosyltransferase involved in cell wall biosynthesis
VTRAKISCVVPAYNAERYLERALRSVFAQSLPPDEIIVVDDGSSDSTPEILARYAGRVRVLRQDNAGPAAARNRGIEVATGELVCFQDADDEWLPPKLAKQAALLAAHPETDLCITHLRNVWAVHRDRERLALGDHAYANDPPGYVFQTSLVRRSVFERIGMLNENLRRAEDIEWFGRVRDAGLGLEILPEVLVHRHLHGRNTSDAGETTASERYQQLLDVVAARLKQRTTAGLPIAH